MNIKSIADNSIIKIIAIVCSIIAIPLAFYSMQTSTYTGYRIRIKSSINVLEINDNTDNIMITYNGKDLKKARENIMVFYISVTNTGNRAIRLTDYDNTALPGIAVTNGRLIKHPELVYANDRYINDHLYINSDTLRHISFSPVILNPRTCFIVKLSVLYQSDTTPKLSATGKLADLDSLYIIDNSNGQADINNNAGIFIGDLKIDALRFAADFLVSVILMFLVVLLIGLIQSSTEHRWEKKLFTKYVRMIQKSLPNADTEIIERIVHQYIWQVGIGMIEALVSISDNNALKEYWSNGSQSYHKIAYGSAVVPISPDSGQVVISDEEIRTLSDTWEAFLNYLTTDKSNTATNAEHISCEYHKFLLDLNNKSTNSDHLEYISSKKQERRRTAITNQYNEYMICKNSKWVLKPDVEVIIYELIRALRSNS